MLWDVAKGVAWIPTFVGMTPDLDSYFHGNDRVQFFSGDHETTLLFKGGLGGSTPLWVFRNLIYAALGQQPQ
jgi:hypothetical protein